MAVHETTKADVAPDRLELLRRFVNTRDIEDDLDELSDPASLRRWLDAAALPAGSETAGDLQAATALREAVRALLRERSDATRAREAVTAFNEAARQTAPVHVELSADGGVSLVPDSGAPRAGLGLLAGLVALHAATPQWDRLKVCANPACQWAFYDHALNRTGRWCNMATCGNRQKARAHRARRTPT